MKIALLICTSFISQIMNGQSLDARQTQQDITRPGTFSLGEVEVIGRHSGNINTSIDVRQIRLLVFLHMLTDSTFITDKRFSDPFE